MTVEFFFTDYTMRTVLLGTALIGAVSGGLGCFAYLRHQSLIGDVVSHSSLLGVVVGFLLVHALTGEGSKSYSILIPGAILSGCAALLLSRLIHEKTRLKEDASLGVMLAIFFGTSLMVINWIQRRHPPIPDRAGLEDYFFGMAAAMNAHDVTVMAGLGISAFALVFLNWKELKAYTFDPSFARSLGMRVRLLEGLLIALLVTGIVIGIQAVGVVLMIALLITPASAARQWTRHLGGMVVLATLIGAFSGAFGTAVSATVGRIPTGPVIALTSTALMILSLIFAPKRGILARKRRNLGKTS